MANPDSTSVKPARDGASAPSTEGKKARTAKAGMRAEPVSAVEAITTPSAAAAATATEEATMDTINTVADKAQTAFADAQARAEAMMAKSQKAFDELNAFAKGNVEALVESSSIAVRGFEALSQDAAAFAKRSFEGATGTAKTLATVKSPTEFVKLQSDFVRSMFDQFISETARGTETMLKLAGEVAQPISTRFAVAAEKVKIAA